MSHTGQNKDSIRVLLIDDHAVVREGYRHLLGSTGRISVVADADSGAAGYRRFLKGGIDVVVIDLSMPGVGGLEVLRRMKHREPELHALVFSMHEEPVIVERALAAGATGYLSKRSDPRTLIDAVTRVHAGSRTVDPALLPNVAARGRASSCAAPTLLHQLSGREFEIFRQLAEGHSVSEIAQHLSLSGKTVANYHTAIRGKLGVGNSAELARLAIAAGVVRLEAA
ncbi:MAG: two component transcriptional regulator, LuxR family [Hydrocarboniphaga sp.]|uniref:response regulator n=1 Tax=Hydrocarboniphaga sp. TaxID=2033016 RepID=UPI00263389B9|nr:response regulator transcription factor [Hydrocarboniphaga sp.]MDB5970256.1 two component transcriptional regulator, LuxR family [Hydrocarboniphaga sp.]